MFAPFGGGGELAFPGELGVPGFTFVPEGREDVAVTLAELLVEVPVIIATVVGWVFALKMSGVASAAPIIRMTMIMPLFLVDVLMALTTSHWENFTNFPPHGTIHEMSLTLVGVFGAFQIILFLMHADIHEALASAFGLTSPWLTGLFWVLSITFVSASVLAHRYTNRFVTWYYRISAYWFGFVQFLFIGSVLFYFSEFFLYRANLYIAPEILGAVSFGIVIVTVLYATWHTNHLILERISISLPYGKTWPESWRGKKIVFVSDLHLGAVRGAKFAERIVDKIIGESPDMVLIGGDMFDGVKCHPQSLTEPFRKLHPPHGMYFASGNHEYIEDTEILLDEIKNVGIRILRNEIVTVNGLQIAGVDWKDTYRGEQFEAVLKKMSVDRSQASILMRHEPSHLGVAERGGISLTLAGHTHRGQIWPLGLITRSLYKGYDYGLKPLRSMMVYTSSGVGTWGPPLRFRTQSEIVVITLT
jgi:predicted MPP superfamily phosphohydrolase